MTETQGESVAGEKWASMLCAALLTGFAFVVAFAVFDRLRIASLEKAEQPVAIVRHSEISPQQTAK